MSKEQEAFRVAILAQASLKEGLKDIRTIREWTLHDLQSPELLMHFSPIHAQEAVSWEGPSALIELR